MKYKCLKSKGRGDLTVGKVYEVTHSDSDGDHVIKVDDGGNFYIKPGKLDNIWATWEFIGDEVTYTQRIANIKAELAQIEQLQDAHVDDQLMVQITKLNIHVPTLVEELETMWALRNIFTKYAWSTEDIASFAKWVGNHKLSGCNIREIADAAEDWEDIMSNDMDDVENAIELWDSLDRDQRDFIGENDLEEIMGMVEAYKQIRDICND